jgi:energy-coupling factor transporter ATP-binding protein EcfA2
MVLLIYRIKANVPVIIMGETGCGKTSLITKLSQILNNGDKLVKIINIHPGITDEEICKKMKEINEEEKKKEYINNEKNKRKELWVFFDEINTCLSLSLLTEIFNNRTFNGEKLEDNIRLIGACNPYRRRELTAEKCGLTREDDKGDDLVYKVEQLPQSLLYYVFSFGSIKDEDEKKYIESILQKQFQEEEKNLHISTTEAISKCHIFLRKTFKDPSIVSLREITRFTKCVEFFQDYFKKKNNQNQEPLDKIKSIICSIYLCYYIRLTNDEKRGQFDNEL